MATRPNGRLSNDFKPHESIKIIYSKKDDSLYVKGVAFSSLLQRLAL